MITLDSVELFVTGGLLTVPVPMTSPVHRGSLEVCVSTVRGGDAAHPTLARTLVVSDGRCEPFTVFAKDIRATFPRGGRAWLVVRYGVQLVATGEVRLVVGN